MTLNHGAYASTLVVAGRQFRIRRDFDLILRIEERFGEIGAFILRAEQERLKANEIVDLYGLLLAGEDDPPSVDDIRGHIIAIGTLKAFYPALLICSSLFLGEERFIEQVMKNLSGNGIAPQTGGA
jgi:hypothetical protein